MLVPFALAVVLAFIAFYGERFCLRCSPHESKIISFAAGISVTYIFLQLLPELYEGIRHLNKFLFSFVLLGFITLHMSEKYIYQHAARAMLLEDLIRLHSASTFVYHFIIGVVLLNLAALDNFNALLFFAPVLFHGTATSITMHKVHEVKAKAEKTGKERKLLEDVSGKPWVRLLVAFAPLYGVLFAFFAPLSPQLQFSLLGLIAGALLFLIIKDTVPREREGKPAYFMAGVILYALLIITSW